MEMSTTPVPRDILDDLLSVGPVGPVPGLDELTALIGLCQEPRKPVPADPAAKRIARKKKSTHYLSEGVFEGLALTRESLVDAIPELSGSRISKSGIVESALMLLLEEFRTKGKESSLVRHIMARLKER